MPEWLSGRITNALDLSSMVRIHLPSYFFVNIVSNARMAHFRDFFAFGESKEKFRLVERKNCKTFAECWNTLSEMEHPYGTGECGYGSGVYCSVDEIIVENGKEPIDSVASCIEKIKSGRKPFVSSEDEESVEETT